MPVIETPYFTDLLPSQELVISRKPATEAAQQQEDKNDGSAGGGFTHNAFTAMVTTIVLEEQEPVEEEDEVPATSTDSKKGGKKKEGSNKSNAASAKPSPLGKVRVTLMANMLDKQESEGEEEEEAAPKGSSSSSTRCFTLASYIFADPTASASETASGETKERKTVPMPTREAFSLMLRRPLFIGSESNIRSLAVVAHTVVDGDDGSEGASSSAAAEDSTGKKGRKGPRVYKGPRRFVVRLIGMQQTILTEEQVLLLSGAR